MKTLSTGDGGEREALLRIWSILRSPLLRGGRPRTLCKSAMGDPLSPSEEVSSSFDGPYQARVAIYRKRRGAKCDCAEGLSSVRKLPADGFDVKNDVYGFLI